MDTQQDGSTPTCWPSCEASVIPIPAPRRVSACPGPSRGRRDAGGSLAGSALDLGPLDLGPLDLGPSCSVASRRFPPRCPVAGSPGRMPVIPRVPCVYSGTPVLWDPGSCREDPGPEGDPAACQPQRWSIDVAIATSMEHRCGIRGAGIPVLLRVEGLWCPARAPGGPETADAGPRPLLWPGHGNPWHR
jgi:hypothetical protein